MSTFASKVVSETITAVFDFFSQLPFGEVLSAPEVFVSVGSGIDYSPEDILSGVAIIAPNSPEMVEQKVTAGMPGVTYILRCKVLGLSGRIYQEVKYLSVLSREGSFAPVSLPVLSGTLPDGVVGAFYSHNLQIAGGYGPYTPVGIVVGMPTWMGFTVVGSELICAGVPNESGSLTNYIFSPAIKDSAQNLASAPQNLDITRVFITGNAPGGVVGQAYSYTYTFGGGTPPYTFAVISGSVPPSTLLNPATSEIAGTLSLLGDYSWEVEITDVNGITATVPDDAEILGGELFVMQLANSSVLRSVDGGLTWNFVNTGVSAGNTMVLSGAGGQVHLDVPLAGKVTVDGVVWNSYTGSFSGTGFPMWQLWNGSIWIRRSVGGLRISVDGTSYAPGATLPNVGIVDPAGNAADIRGSFIVSGYWVQPSTYGVMNSVDGGATWAAYGAPGRYFVILATANHFLGFRGASGTVDMSVTGINGSWISQWASVPTPTFIFSAAYSPTLNRIVVGTAFPGGMHYSDDEGATWSPVYFLPDVDGIPWPSGSIDKMIWALGKFILITNTTVTPGFRMGIFISPDGINWTNTYAVPSEANYLYGIAAYQDN